MTDNKYWIYLERLRRSGVTNMHGATPYLIGRFQGLTESSAREILLEWMRQYNPNDYEGLEDAECT